GKLPTECRFDAANYIIDVKIIALLATVAVDDKGLFANDVSDEAGDNALFMRRKRTIYVGKAQCDTRDPISASKCRAVALHSKLGRTVWRKGARRHVF